MKNVLLNVFFLGLLSCSGQITPGGLSGLVDVKDGKISIGGNNNKSEGTEIGNGQKTQLLGISNYDVLIDINGNVTGVGQSTQPLSLSHNGNIYPSVKRKFLIQLNSKYAYVEFVEPAIAGILNVDSGDIQLLRAPFQIQNDINFSINGQIYGDVFKYIYPDLKQLISLNLINGKETIEYESDFGQFDFLTTNDTLWPNRKATTDFYFLLTVPKAPGSTVFSTASQVNREAFNLFQLIWGSARHYLALPFDGKYVYASLDNRSVLVGDQNIADANFSFQATSTAFHVARADGLYSGLLDTANGILRLGKVVYDEKLVKQPQFIPQETIDLKQAYGLKNAEPILCRKNRTNDQGISIVFEAGVLSISSDFKTKKFMQTPALSTASSTWSEDLANDCYVDDHYIYTLSVKNQLNVIDLQKNPSTEPDDSIQLPDNTLIYDVVDNERLLLVYEDGANTGDFSLALYNHKTQEEIVLYQGNEQQFNVTDLFERLGGLIVR